MLVMLHVSSITIYSIQHIILSPQASCCTNNLLNKARETCAYTQSMNDCMMSFACNRVRMTWLITNVTK